MEQERSEKNKRSSMTKSKGCGIAVGICFYIILVYSSCWHLPTSLFLRMLPPLVVIPLLLRGTHVWLKYVVAILFGGVALYMLFCNDIIGPMEFSICDTPVDVPAQFNHSWRYFWVMAYLYEVLWTWGVLSLILIVGYRIWGFRKTKKCSDYETEK